MDNSKETLNLNETSVLWENRSRIVAMEGAIKYIELTLDKISAKLDSIESKTVSRQYVADQIAQINEKYQPVKTGIYEIVKYVIFAVIGALLTFLIK